MADPFVYAPYFVEIARDGERRITKDRSQEHYTVWDGGEILAVGSEAMCRQVFAGLPVLRRPAPREQPATEAPPAAPIQLGLF
jgi:hypothetical protein